MQNDRVGAAGSGSDATLLTNVPFVVLKRPNKELVFDIDVATDEKLVSSPQTPRSIYEDKAIAVVVPACTAETIERPRARRAHADAGVSPTTTDSGRSMAGMETNVSAPMPERDGACVWYGAGVDSGVTDRDAFQAGYGDALGNGRSAVCASKTLPRTRSGDG